VESASPTNEIDSLGRTAATTIAVARIGIGLGAFVLTRPALGVLGFDRPDGRSVALARLAGGRDVALGMHALAVRDDRARLREASAIATAVDAGDMIAFGAALVRRDGIDRTAVKNIPITVAAVVAGTWVTARLGSP